MSIRNSTGHTLLVERARGPQWYVKLRTPEERQVKRLIGPAWSKRGRPPEGFFTEALAAAKLEEMLMAADRGEDDDKPAHTFGAACREWLRYLEHEEQVAERTLMTDRGAASARLIPFFGEDTPIREITTKRINEYRTAALLGDERIGRGRPLKRTTVSRDMTNLSAIFKRALEEGWIATNPYLTAKKVKQKPAKSRDYNALTVPELEAVVSVARAEQEAAL
jgi:integrase